ncbi:helix-hairpin-helix domain-containing protein [Undibacterium cyanobacteriorum]|uniref:Helix-hairpin-helix domain-containing protein n=1 Tax=Undibacterium cyanobacteriorum TaxID=3073561 RepID=A0ABY9RFH1_9BURK|nr:helix-hairpin-helix domain-containing protein [Undibacterium sp. 20NA77.5]WMW79380.1 helix-hairpin-helix domain-containing protein [Undibacterium sp. 20NA77.5]
MLKKIVAISFGLLLSVFAMTSFAFADVDVNKADQAALDGVKGLGPVKSKAILSERKKHGEFKDWADFESRVKGIGDKSAAKLSEAGLTVNGKARPAAAASGASASASAPVAAPAKAAASAPASAPAVKPAVAPSSASKAATSK